VPKTYNGIKTGFSTNIVGKLDICMLKTESWCMIFTLYKY
jgi:hypothetical protein